MSALSRSLIDAAAREIRDAYEQLPDGTRPEFTEVHEWHGEARAAVVAVLETLADGTQARIDKCTIKPALDCGRCRHLSDRVADFRRLAAEIREATS